MKARLERSCFTKVDFGTATRTACWTENGESYMVKAPRNQSREDMDVRDVRRGGVLDRMVSAPLARAVRAKSID